MEWKGEDIVDMVKRVQRKQKAPGSMNKEDESQPSLWYIIPGKNEPIHDWRDKFRICD